MTKKYAEAEIVIEIEALAEPIRRRMGEADIEIESLPGFDADAGQEFKVACESMEELQELLMAINEQDEETVRKYIKEEDD